MKDDEIAVEIQRVLYLRPCGKENAIDARTLAWKITEIFREPVGERRIRKVIEKHALFIASCSKGYYIPKDFKEAEEAAKHFDKHIIALSKRRKAIELIYPDLAQLKLEFIYSGYHKDTSLPLKPL